MTIGKIYLVCYDDDMTLRSTPQPVIAYLTKQAALDFANQMYGSEETKPFYQKTWKIQELELVGE